MMPKRPCFFRTSPDFLIVILERGFPLPVPSASMAFTTSMPSSTAHGRGKHMREPERSLQVRGGSVQHPTGVPEKCARQIGWAPAMQARHARLMPQPAQASLTGQAACEDVSLM